MKIYKVTIGKYTYATQAGSNWTDWNPINRLSKKFSSLAKAKKYAKDKLNGHPERTASYTEQLI